ncbi:hypothetical protein EWM64_g9880 [Hericium alpestre]|uniref:Uncharacterized protein n=1 Tax=Hericium alpestre TaxID=135208 RepID=A0A4Y9ZHM3_9AGAM|nr:hypothetical protein EWM64_g9880 [Hericium alpestre]
MDVLPALAIPAQGQTALQRPVRGPLSSTEIIHHRLATRFRGEACVLALKRLEALAAASSNAVADDLELRAAKRGKVGRQGGINGGSADVGKHSIE